ncbi:amino acid adenylation domain-containing protein [Xenorhabdus entomophaga]|uniref:amino acid adenylation domain-containing protein n=1 Tax=Xenorhabdus entomophaga TaxID=3136257 RepID=UPI0030F3A4FD
MKNAAQMIKEAGDQGIKLFIDNGQLKYETNRDSIPSELFKEWINNKKKLIDLLNQPYQKEETQYIILEKKRDYWQKQLSGVSLLHHFPLDNPRPEKQSFEKCTRQQRIPKNLIQEISVLCARHEVTLFTFLETAFAVLLSRYNNEKDILVGTLLTERKHYDIDSLIGSFANLLVIRTNLSGQPTFSELLKKNSHTILDAYAHQDLPFEMLVEEINPNRNLNYNPIFQIAFTLETSTPEKSHQQDTALKQDNHIDSKEYLSLKNRLDLDIRIYEEDTGELSLLWSYDTHLFESVTIERLTANYETLLANIVDALTQHISGGSEPSVHHIPLLSDTEKHTLLHEWNGPQKNYRPARCFHELFEEQAVLTPEKTALLFGDDSLSYRELNEQSNQLAHYLIEQGVEPDTLVALFIPRSLQAIVALLGILKAGGAYVPLDPTYPQARLQYMLEHSEVELILTETHLVEKLPVSQQKVIYLDTQTLRSHLQTRPTKNITDRPIPLTEEHLAYVIYTSGSTGKPKGVMVKHRGWVNLALSQAALFGLDINSRVLQFASLSFVAMTIEMAMSFPCGATLCLISEKQQHTPDLLDDVVEQYQITHTMLPQALLPHLNFDKWHSVSALLLAGEALPPQIATRWKPGRKLFNAYGATETSSMVTAGLLNGDRVTIGKPLPNIVARIFDPDRKLVPIGVIGELHIGGSQLSRGYRNAQEITEKQFIRDPYADDNATNRLYRTGDLARWTSDGQLEYIGRTDSLVKIRGYRVELGEIEDTLNRHDALSSAAVIAYGEDNEDKRLIAYVCPNEQWMGERAAEFNTANIESWTEIFDEQYRQSIADDPAPYDSDFTGWVSSYTKLPIAREQMEEWLAGTMHRINALQPRRLLEIGCGTGLHLYRYAEQCEYVLASDISAEILNRHQQTLQQRGWQHVRLRKGDALNLGALGTDEFDTVIINAVVHCFPNRQYLEKVLEQLMPAISEGGKILLGDIRNLDLLTAHATAIEQSQLLDGQSIQAGALANRIQRRLQQESELLLSPAYFAQLPEHYPEIDRVDILVKRGVGDNEMLRYRYDVILYKRGENTQSSRNLPLIWCDFSSFENLRNLLHSGVNDTFGVSGIPNARVKDDLTFAEELRHWPATQMISPTEYAGSFSPQAAKQVQEFESLLQYAQQCGYQCGVTWSQKQSDMLDVIFSRDEMPPVQARHNYNQSQLTNYPQISTVGGELSELLKSFLKTQLPEYMVPNLYLLLERMPLTPNNKVDKKALLTPNEEDFHRKTYVAPRDEIEQKISQLWQKLLNVSQVGIDDNFFTLGGHSLQATRLISSIRNELKIEVPLISIFEHPTLEQLSQVITVHLIKEKRKNFPTEQNTTLELLEGDI